MAVSSLNTVNTNVIHASLNKTIKTKIIKQGVFDKNILWCCIILFLISSTLQCPPNCSKCLVDTECTECENGYFLDPNKLCAACQKGCKACHNLKICKLCEDQYSLMFGTCEPCANSRCLSCSDNPNVCNKCARGFNLTSEGDCVYRWQTYIAIALLIMVGLMFLIVGICCLRSNGPVTEDTNLDEEEDRIYRRLDSQGNPVQAQYSDVLSPSVKAKDNRGIYVSILQNIGADSVKEQSKLVDVEDKEKDSFISSAGRPQLNQLIKKGSVDYQQQPNSYEPNFPASQN